MEYETLMTAVPICWDFPPVQRDLFAHNTVKISSISPSIKKKCNKVV